MVTCACTVYGAWWEVVERGSSYTAPLVWIGFQRFLCTQGYPVGPAYQPPARRHASRRRSLIVASLYGATRRTF
jgi:hypothetical protein